MKGIFNLIWCFISLFVLFLLALAIGNFIDNSFSGFLIFAICVGSYYYLVFRNSESRVKRAYSKLGDILMKDEAIIVKGIDKRPFALLSRRQVFAVTNSRIIRLKRGRLGGFDMNDFQWKDLEDAQVSENVLSSLCGATLTFKARHNGVSMDFAVFPELEIASKAYKHAQQEEQSWEEKRRIRGMEENRSKVGGVMIGQNTVPAASKGIGSKENQNPDIKIDIADELLKLKKLLDEGILSDAEFQEMKSKILARSTQNF